MKKLTNKYLAKIIIAVLFCISSISAFGQVCEDSSADYRNTGKKVFYDKPVEGYVRINNAEGSEGRMVFVAFTAKDEKGRIIGGVVRDNKIVFSPGGKVASTGDWYVIYQKAKDFPVDVEKYLSPFDLKQLPTGDETVKVPIVPLTKYKFGDNVIASLPQWAIDGRTVESTIKKLPSSMEFDTTNLEPGLYWFTLQGTAVSPQENSSQCAKTTPPVLIEVKPEYTNYQPTVSVKVAGEYCYQKTIAIDAGDRNNEPNDPLNPQTITLSWKITNKTTGAVVKSDKGTFTSATYNVNIPTGDIPLGNYTVEADVDDGRLKNSTRGGLDNTDLDLKCKGAGIAYFQFDEPFGSEKRKIRFNPGYYTNPEDWVAVNTRVKVKNQCKNSQGLYPDQEFPDFYEAFFGNGTTPFPVENNTEKLKRIIDTLIANPNYRIIIRGYADFRNSDDYNVALVERRLQVVKNYLENRSKELGSPITNERYTLIRNLYDSKSRCKNESDYKDSCFVERRQDRRVELIYYADAFTVEQLGLPEYADSKCDPNAMLVNFDGIEWEADE